MKSLRVIAIVVAILIMLSGVAASADAEPSLYWSIDVGHPRLNRNLMDEFSERVGDEWQMDMAMNYLDADVQFIVQGTWTGDFELVVSVAYILNGPLHPYSDTWMFVVDTYDVDAREYIANRVFDEYIQFLRWALDEYEEHNGSSGESGQSLERTL